ncbi:MAG TPA: efflux RND transporter periplasmic adaptor subunit [Candidatus Paceibacterota bacterium]
MSIFSKTIKYIRTHKVRSIIALIIVIVGVVLIVRASHKEAEATTYMLGTAEKGTIISTVSGTGQVSNSNSLDINPEASGELIAIYAKPGDKVTKGKTLFVIKSTDAQKSLRDAQISLQSAQLSYDSYINSSQNSTADLKKAVDRAYSTLLSSQLEAMPGDRNLNATAPTISGNYTLGSEGTITLTTYKTDAGYSFNMSGLANGIGTVNTTTAQPLGASGLFIKFPATVNENQTWTITIPNKNSSSYVSNLNAYENAVQDLKEATTVKGTNEIELQQKQLSLQQAKNSVFDAQQNLAKYYVKAPLTGTLASTDVIVGQQVGSGTALGTIITNQQVAIIPFNEIDAAKVAVGQKATMTFDAIDELTVTGKIIQVDTLGTVSQGVVNYNVKIAFDTTDARIKSGMSVSATIATDVRQDVVLVPIAAVKTDGNASYVLQATSATDPAPKQLPVTIGISDDTNTEIVEGLTEGESIVVRSMTTSNTKQSSTQAPSILNSVGGSTRGGAVRAGGMGATPTMRTFTR